MTTIPEAISDMRPDVVGAMVIVYHEENADVPCTSFKDVAHVLSHIAFFTDHYGLVTQFNIEGASGEYHNITTNEDGRRVCQLTSKGRNALSAEVCNGTTAFGRPLGPGDMKGFEANMPHTAGTGKTVKLPHCPLYQATSADPNASTGLHRETNFTLVEDADISAVLASKIPVAFETHSSTGVVSLFMRTSLCQIGTLPDEITGKRIQRHLCQPKMNARTVIENARLYDGEKLLLSEVNDDAGLIETALGRGHAGNNFIGPEIFLAPYSFCETGSAPEGSAEVYTVEVAMDLVTTLENNPKARIITQEEVRFLSNVLVTGMTEEAVAGPEFGEEMENSEVRATRAFTQLLGTIQEVYGGLKTTEDWLRLYKRLCNCGKLRKYNLERVSEELPWPELNYMVHHMMGAVSPLSVGVLDGLGRICATKLASISRYPQLTYYELNNPSSAVVPPSDYPDFRVIGQKGTVKCLTLNNGSIWGEASLKMCREYSKGVLTRSTQATSTGLRDLLNEFLTKVQAEREKYYCGNTCEEMEASFDKLREEAYDCIFGDATTTNNHLKLIHAQEMAKKQRTLEKVKADCSRTRLGHRKHNGLTIAVTAEPNHLITWLVYVLTNGFFFATKALCPESPDESYSQMLILLRNNGNQERLKQHKDHDGNLYAKGETARFKGFFPNSKETALLPYAKIFSDIVCRSTMLVACSLEADLMKVPQRKKNHNTKIIKILSHLNSQTAVLQVLNTYGVVIAVPRNRGEDLENFVSLMDPMREWCGSTPVCQDKEERMVYSNLTKFIQLVIWTCLHPFNQSVEARLEHGLPFSFAEAKELDFKTFFGDERELSQKWKSIKTEENSEKVVRPTFQVVCTKEPVSLLGLLQFILYRETTDDCVSESWRNWDSLLSSFPGKGVKSLWSTPIKSSRTLVGKSDSAEYRKLAKELGYHMNSTTSGAHSKEHKSETRNKKEKETESRSATQNNTKPLASDDDDKANPMTASPADQFTTETKADSPTETGTVAAQKELPTSTANNGELELLRKNNPTDFGQPISNFFEQEKEDKEVANDERTEEKGDNRHLAESETEADEIETQQVEVGERFSFRYTPASQRSNHSQGDYFRVIDKDKEDTHDAKPTEKGPKRKLAESATVTVKRGGAQIEAQEGKEECTGKDAINEMASSDPCGVLDAPNQLRARALSLMQQAVFTLACSQADQQHPLNSDTFDVDLFTMSQENGDALLALVCNMECAYRLPAEPGLEIGARKKVERYLTAMNQGLKQALNQNDKGDNDQNTLMTAAKESSEWATTGTSEPANPGNLEKSQLCNLESDGDEQRSSDQEDNRRALKQNKTREHEDVKARESSGVATSSTPETANPGHLEKRRLCNPESDGDEQSSSDQEDNRRALKQNKTRKHEDVKARGRSGVATSSTPETANRGHVGKRRLCDSASDRDEGGRDSESDGQSSEEKLHSRKKSPKPKNRNQSGRKLVETEPKRKKKKKKKSPYNIASRQMGEPK